MSETTDYLGAATEYLKKNNISYYDAHISYIKKYRDFLYSQDKNYTQESVCVNKVVEGEDLVKVDLVKVDKSLTKIHLLVVKEFASSLFNEQIDFKPAEDDSNNNAAITKATTALEKHYIDNQVWQMLENSIIEVLGVGTLGIVTTFDSVYGIQHINYPANCILPLKIIGNKIIDVCFIGTDTNDNQKTRLTIFRQKIVDEVITSADLAVPNRNNKKIDGYDVDIITLDRDNNVIAEETIKEHSEIRPFIILKPFNRFVIEYSNAFGYPIYWDYLDTIKNIDDLYNLEKRDANLSQRRLFINEDLIKDDSGNLMIPPDLKDAFITIVNSGSGNTNKSSDFFQEFAPNPIMSIYNEAIENKTKYLSSAVGLGSNTLSLNKITAPTATQIISENTEKFTNTLKHYSQMRDELIVFNQIILYLLNKHAAADVDYKIKIMYNTTDNIIEDTNTIVQRALQEKSAGVLSAYLYLKNIKGLSGKELIDELARHGLDENGMNKVVPIQLPDDNKLDGISSAEGVSNKDNKEV